MRKKTAIILILNLGLFSVALAGEPKAAAGTRQDYRSKVEEIEKTISDNDIATRRAPASDSEPLADSSQTDTPSTPDDDGGK